MNARHLLVTLVTIACVAVSVAGVLLTWPALVSWPTEAEGRYMAFLEKEIGTSTVQAAATRGEWIELGHAVCTADHTNTAQIINVVDGIRGLDSWDAAVAVGGARTYLCGEPAA